MDMAKPNLPPFVMASLMLSATTINNDKHRREVVPAFNLRTHCINTLDVAFPNDTASLRKEKALTMAPRPVCCQALDLKSYSHAEKTEFIN